MENTRRSFLKKVSAAGIGAAGLAMAGNAGATTTAAEPQKKKTAGKDDGKLRFGFIGTGSRCHEHINNVLAIPGNKIVAICDIQQGPIDSTLKHIAKFNVPAPKVYKGGEREFENMLNNEEFDCVIIASPWEWHVPMSVAAMAALNMVRQGLFGEILHGTCGYEHDLREVKFNDGTHYNYVPGSGDLRMGPTAFAEAQWRTNHSVHRNGDIYPTHGIGPIANCMDINRGNRFLSLSAMATQSRGLHKFIVDNGGENHPLAKVNFNLGDIVTSMIKCSNGQTIIVTHDTNSPRPYSLGFRVQGTEGLWMNDGDHVYVQGKSKPHRWDDSDEWFKKYDHKLWASLESQAAEAGHGGMDFIMMYDLIDAIRNKKPAPMDCYDAAAWSAISGLSEMSIARGGALVDFPDFTRGQWIHRKPQFAL